VLYGTLDTSAEMSVRKDTKRFGMLKPNVPSHLGTLVPVVCPTKGQKSKVESSFPLHATASNNGRITHFACSSVYPGAHPNTGMDMSPTVPATL